MLSVNFTALSTPLGTALRCDFSNITLAQLSTVTVVSYGLSDGTFALVSPSDPINTATCDGIVHRRRLELHQRELAGVATITYINVTAVVPQHAAAAAIAAVVAAPYAAFAATSALTQVQPSLLAGGPSSRGVNPGQSAPIGAVQTTNTGSFTPSPSATGTSTATPTISAPAAAPAPVTASDALSTQGAAIIGGTVAAIVVLAALIAAAVLACGSRKRVVGDRSAVAAQPASHV